MRKMTIIGIILMAAGLVIGIGMFGGGMTLKVSKDPANSNEGIITSSGDTLELGSGTHRIWIMDDVSGPIIVRGPNNHTYTVESSSTEDEYGDITSFGDLRVEEKGEHRFEYTGTGDLYVTEDFSIGTYNGMMYVGTGAGILMILIGLVLLVIGIKRQKAMDHSSFFQEPPTKEPETKQGTIEEGAGGH